MSAEFTGERVVPGQVDADLWNEHLSRYAFAARLARRKRVLDIGCGTGYGSAELANTASAVTAIDVSAEAIAYATANFSRPNVKFETASATTLPFTDQSFDLIVAFEVIEHLPDWPQLLAEACRLLAPAGQFVVSTPNVTYYNESRRSTGPNPFHTHEFTFEEFHAALAQHFPHTLFFTQNHSSSILFRPTASASPSAEVRLDGAPGETDAAHFFIAVCALQPMTGAPAFLYVPTAANVLREREHHIQRLAAELTTKDAWLAESQAKHAELVALHDAQTAELKSRNEWAQALDKQVKDAGLRIEELQDQLAAQQAAAREAVDGYEAEIARLEAERAAAIEWGQGKESELTAQLETSRAEFARCLELFQQAESTVEERTRWAQTLDAEIAVLRQQIKAIGDSKWLRLGRSIGIGPKVE